MEGSAAPPPARLEARRRACAFHLVRRTAVMTGLQPVKKFTPFSVEALLADVVSSGPRDVQEAQVTSSSSSNSEPDLCLPPEQALHWGAAWFARSPTTPGLGECPLPLHRRPAWTRPRELAAFQPRSAARALVQWRQ